MSEKKEELENTKKGCGRGCLIYILYLQVLIGLTTLLAGLFLSNEGIESESFYRFGSRALTFGLLWIYILKRGWFDKLNYKKPYWTIELKPDEEILHIDKVLHYSSSFFAHHADCWLTNKRLILEPRRHRITSFFSKKVRREIEIEKILRIEKKFSKITIHHEEIKFDIGGPGAKRISEHIKLL